MMLRVMVATVLSGQNNVCVRWGVFFFFSSRRRHTRLQGDWSSDVCSSDLAVGAVGDGVIKVKWKDRSFDRIDLSGWIGTGGNILAPLRNGDVFRSPRVSE